MEYTEGIKLGWSHTDSAADTSVEQNATYVPARGDAQKRRTLRECQAEALLECKHGKVSEASWYSESDSDPGLPYHSEAPA